MNATAEKLTIHTSLITEFDADPRKMYVYEGLNYVVACTDLGARGLERQWAIEVSRYVYADRYDSGWQEIAVVTGTDALRVIIEHYLNAN